MKRVEIDGRFYRKRRGKLVEILPEWVGKTLHPQTKRKRASKGTGKARRRRDHGAFPKQHPRHHAPRLS